MLKNRATYEHHHAWFPLLYFSKGVSYITLMVFPIVLFKQLGINNSLITFYASLLYLPWVLKPIWKPFLNSRLSYRSWIVFCHVLIGVFWGGFALILSSTMKIHFMLYLLGGIACLCGINNWATDNYYKLNLEKYPQVWIFDARLLFYRLAMVFGQGFLIMMLGNFQVIFRNNTIYSWSLICYITAGFIVLLAFLHLICLPYSKRKQEIPNPKQMAGKYLAIVKSPKALLIGGTILLFYIPEGFLSKVSLLFLLEPIYRGGIGLSPQEFGLIQGTIGVFALMIGGLLGNKLFHKDALCHRLWIIACAWIIPNIVYIYMAFFQPNNFFFLNCCIFIKQFGYGIAFMGWMQIVNHINNTQTPYHMPRELCKALMALGLMIPGLCSGSLLFKLGYQSFFIFVLFSGIASIWALFLLKKKIFISL